MAEKINVIGGGLAGSLLSICMAKRGFEVNLFERRPDMRKIVFQQVNLLTSHFPPEGSKHWSRWVLIRKS